MKFDSNTPSRRAYGSIGFGSDRRKAILAAAAAYFGDVWKNNKIQHSFSNLIDSATWASQRRDDIAHGIFRGITRKEVDRGYFLHLPTETTGRDVAFDENEEER